MLRKHQQETLNIVDGIIAGSGVTKIVLHAVPGSGKSLIPIIAGKLITAGLADALAWITPRKTLQEQGERGFIDPVFRQMLGHDLVIRTSTNDKNPCRGVNGFATTYQAVAMDEKSILQDEFSRWRYILILDEFHHVEAGGVWHQALQPLVEQAAYMVLMTGTLERGDEKPIAFIPYQATPVGLIPVIDQDPDAKLITYTREVALMERAILPLHFVLNDGDVEWEKDGETFSGKLSKTFKDAGAAIWTAMSTGFADELLKMGLDHWQEYRLQHPRAKALIVVANISQAKRTLSGLKGMGLNAEIATSSDHDGAVKAIRKFKGPECDILVSVAMVYEGFDEPQATHIICLTHIRSTSWIEQMVARVVRIDPHAGPYEAQMGYVFAPDDFLMRRIISRIKTAQLAFAHAREKRDPQDLQQGEAPPDGSGGTNPYGITPIGSKLTGQREYRMGGDDSPAPTYQEPWPQEEVKTQSEIEKELRDEIENHLRKFAFTNYYLMQRINREVKDAFEGKPRAEMTVPELQKVLSHVRNYYPMERTAPDPWHKRRGAGRRVPAKAMEWNQLSMF